MPKELPKTPDQLLAVICDIAAASFVGADFQLWPHVRVAIGVQAVQPPRRHMGEPMDWLILFSAILQFQDQLADYPQYLHAQYIFHHRQLPHSHFTGHRL
jgi:hypothetical protein